MRKFVLLALLLAVGATAGLAAVQFKVRDDLTWSVTKSPNTGRCYEIADRRTFRSFGYGYMGMAEVPCGHVGL
tara:strand:+ start:1007 stop:1225 length:219 start_codon:yes stop_codon:yes gene_type:complete